MNAPHRKRDPMSSSASPAYHSLFRQSHAQMTWRRRTPGVCAPRVRREDLLRRKEEVSGGENQERGFPFLNGVTTNQGGFYRKYTRHLHAYHQTALSRPTMQQGGGIFVTEKGEYKSSLTVRPPRVDAPHIPEILTAT